MLGFGLGLRRSKRGFSRVVRGLVLLGGVVTACLRFVATVYFPNLLF